MSKVQFRNGKYRVQIRRKGFPIVCRTFNTEEEARLFIAHTESSIENVKNGNSFVIPKLPLKIWIDRWRKEIRPTRSYATKEDKYLNFWENELGNLIACEIDPMRIEMAADKILKMVSKYQTLMTVETRRKYLLMLSSLYTTAIRFWKWATFNPLTGVDMKKRTETQKPLLKESLPFVEEFMSQFREIVSKKMKEKNLSQRDAASLCGLSLHVFQFSMTNGENPTIKSFMKICNGFKIKVELN